MSGSLLHRGLLVLAVLAALAAAAALHLINIFNLRAEIRPHDFEQCHVVRGPVGSEDLALDTGGSGLVYVSADARTWLPQLAKDGFTTWRDVAPRMANLTKEQQGAIWAYDPREPASSTTGGRMIKLQIEGLPDSVTDLHPHGIHMPVVPPAIDGEEDQPTWLYVINHARGGDEVLVLEVLAQSQDQQQQQQQNQQQPSAPSWPPRLLFRGVLRHPLLVFTNDLVSLCPVRNASDGSWTHSMYISRFMGSRFGDAAWLLIESLTRAPWGSVLLCQASSSSSSSAASASSTTGVLESVQCEAAIERISGPNGLALSRNRSELYVACSLTMDIKTFALPASHLSTTTTATAAGAGADSSAPAQWRHGSTPLLPLRLLSTQALGTSVDNIDVDPDSGDLFVGAHLKMADVGAHQADPVHKRAPTQVLRLHRRSSGRDNGNKHADTRLFDVSEIHMSDGSVFSGSSTGVWDRRNGKLLIGGVSDDGIFVCPYSDSTHSNAQAAPAKQTQNT